MECGRGLGRVSRLLNGAPTRAARAVFPDIGRKTATNRIFGAQPASNYAVFDSFFEQLANYRKNCRLQDNILAFRGKSESDSRRRRADGMLVRMVDAMGGVLLSQPPDTSGGYRMVDAMGGVSLLQPPDTSGGYRMVDVPEGLIFNQSANPSHIKAPTPPAPPESSPRAPKNYRIRWIPIPS